MAACGGAESTKIVKVYVRNAASRWYVI